MDASTATATATTSSSTTPDAARTAPAAASSRAGSRSTGDPASAEDENVRLPRPNRRARFAAAAASGVVFAACSPPIDFLPGVFVGLGLFSVALQRAPRTGFVPGWLFGLTANVVALRFVPSVIGRFTPLPLAAQWLALALLASAQAIPWGLGATVTRLLARRVPGVPAWLSFALGTYVATMVPAIFPWTPAGGLAPWPALLQMADVVGERGVSFVVAIVSALAAEGAARLFSPILAARASSAPPGAEATRAWRLPAIALAILASLAAYGMLRMHGIEAARDDAPHARVALVQPGFDASDRWDADRASLMVDRLASLTKSAESRGADLVVWPESSYPYTLPRATRRSPTGPRAVLQPGVRGPVLTGAYLRGEAGEGYNSAVLATSDGALSKPYDKRHLLWFGETVPLADSFPWLRRVFARGTGLAPGTESVAFAVKPVPSSDGPRASIRAAVLNCYEDTLPVAGREAMEVRPNLLVNLTNDAWFVGSAEGELHLRLAVLRAIETRRDLVRAVNRGPTSFVDAAGRVVARYDDGVPGTLTVSPALLEAPVTLYSRFGDAPLVLLAAAAILKLHRQKTAGADPARDGRPSIA